MSVHSKIVWALIASLLLNIVVFIGLALEQDKLNARIRELEIRAGLGDKWADSAE